MNARIFFGILAVILSTSAVAEWTLFDTTRDDTGRPVKLYIDHSTIKKIDDRGKVWSYVDFPTSMTRSGKTFRSMRNLNEFDCKEDRHRVTSLTAFAQNQLKGAAVLDASFFAPWDPIPPDTTINDLAKLVCK